jgi:Tol biopolymer transport system component
LKLTKDEGNKAVVGFSADGTEIFFRQTLGTFEIWSIPTLGGMPNQLGTGTTVTASADGQSLFLVKPDGRLVLTSKSGVGEELIYRFPARVTCILKPYQDGKSLLVASSGSSPTMNLQRLDLSAHTLENLSELPDTSSRISWGIPGKSIYVSRAVNGIRNLWEFSVIDHSSRQLTSGTGPDRFPMPNPNGEGIYFINGKTNGALTRYRVASKQASDIVSEAVTQPEISDDGRHLAYITTPELEKAELWVSDIEGNNRLKLASSGIELETLAWSNDATKLLFADSDGKDLKLFVIDADSSHLRQLPWSGDFVGFAIWEPGDRSIVLGGLDKNGRDEKNWRISLDNTTAVPSLKAAAWPLTDHRTARFS